MRSSCSGVTSKRIAFAAGSSPMSPTRWPVTTAPPSDRRRAASASAMRCEPPRGIGQFATCVVTANISAKEPVSGASSGRAECAASPASSARVRGERKRRASTRAGRIPGMPSRASRNGCRGIRRSGPSASAASSSHARESGSTSRRYMRPSAPRPLAVASIDRSSRTAVPSSRGCASAAGGSIHSSPSRPRSSARKNGDAAPIGWNAEQTSWRNPGRVSAAERQPPPIVSFASSTDTDSPSRASAIAAERPFGPAPTTTASGDIRSASRGAGAGRTSRARGAESRRGSRSRGSHAPRPRRRGTRASSRSRGAL